MDPEPKVQSDHMEDVRPNEAGSVHDDTPDEELSLDEQIASEDKLDEG